MRSILLAALIGLLIAGCAAAPAAAPVATPTVAATQVNHYTAVAPDGPTQSGTCFAGSIAAPRPDAWRCMVGNSILDPCFATGDSTVLLCEPNPATGDAGTGLKLTQPLPAADGNPADLPPSPWLVQLADGTFCTPFTGTRGMIDGKMTTYGCASGDPDTRISILDDLQPGMIWEAQIAVNDQVRQMAVKAVWE